MDQDPASNMAIMPTAVTPTTPPGRRPGGTRMYREVKTIRLESRRLTRSKLASISSVLDAFNASVNFLIQQAVRNPAFQKISRGGMRYFAYPFPKVRKTFYCAWKARFRPLHTHYCHSAARIASEIRTSWSTWQRKARAVVDCPVYKKRRARLEAVLCRFDGRNIILVTGPRQHIFVPMAMYQHALKIITMFGIENCGEITISLDERARKLVAYLPFSRDVEATEPCSFVPIDINERSIDHAVVTENALGLGSIDTSEVSTVHYTYSLKRRRIQESIDTSTPYRVKKRKELLAKYGRRERNKTKELLPRMAAVEDEGSEAAAEPVELRDVPATHDLQGQRDGKCRREGEREEHVKEMRQVWQEHHVQVCNLHLPAVRLLHEPAPARGDQHPRQVHRGNRQDKVEASGCSECRSR